MLSSLADAPKVPAAATDCSCPARIWPGAAATPNSCATAVAGAMQASVADMRKHGTHWLETAERQHTARQQLAHQA